MIEVDWPHIKKFMEQRPASLQYIDMGSYLWVICIDGTLTLITKIKVGDVEHKEFLIDFEENFKEQSNTKIVNEVKVVV